MVCAALLAAEIAAAQSQPEKLIEAGHWKRARTLVEALVRERPNDALGYFLLSQVRNAFGDHDSPRELAEKAVALDGGTAKYHRQAAEVAGVTAQFSNLFQQLLLARKFRKEIETALALDPHDTQALRDLMEFYLLAPVMAGGDKNKARATAEQIARVDAAEGWLAQARLAEFADRQGIEGFLRQAVEAGPANYRARIALAKFELAAHPGAAADQAREALKIDGGRVDAYVILAEGYAGGRQWDALDGILAAAEKEVPDDLAPYYRAACVLLSGGLDLDRAERYLRKYLSGEPEGNQPTAADAQRKLALVLERGARP